MTKYELWNELVVRNPRMANKRVALSRKGLKEFFDLVWDMAHDNGRTVGWANGIMDEKRRESDEREE